VHPHCLRKAFETALRDNGLDPKDQEFLMGHILPESQDTYYDKTKISELREKYAKIVFFPQKRFQAACRYVIVGSIIIVTALLASECLPRAEEEPKEWQLNPHFYGV
jgi:hypothetical protein